DTSNFDRALGFFDAVYGFALTLLVTTIDITNPAAWRSLDSLWSENGSQLLSFAISFVVSVLFWRANHQLIGRFAALDGVTIAANVVVMGFVVFIPFTTDAMGSPQLQELPLPTALYAFNVALAILAGVVMFQVALRRGLVEDALPPRARRAELLDSLVGPVVCRLSIPVTYWGGSRWGDASAGKLFWLLLLVLGPITGRWADRVARRARGESTPAG